jgi:hypothetical protein
MRQILATLPVPDDQEFALTFLDMLSDAAKDSEALARRLAATSLSPTPLSPLDRWFLSAGADGMRAVYKEKYAKFVAKHSAKISRVGACLLYGDVNEYKKASALQVEGASISSYLHILACLQKDDSDIDAYVRQVRPDVSHICSHKHCIEPTHVFLETRSDNMTRSACQKACLKCGKDKAHCGLQPQCLRVLCESCAATEASESTTRDSQESPAKTASTSAYKSAGATSITVAEVVQGITAEGDKHRGVVHGGAVSDPTQKGDQVKPPPAQGKRSAGPKI